MYAHKNVVACKAEISCSNESTKVHAKRSAVMYMQGFVGVYKPLVYVKV